MHFAHKLLIFEPVEHERVLREGGKPCRLVGDDSQILLLLFGREPAFEKEVGEAVYRGDGRFELVREVVNKLVFERLYAFKFRAHLVEVDKNLLHIAAARNFELVAEFPVRNLVEPLGQPVARLRVAVGYIHYYARDARRNGGHYNYGDNVRGISAAV